MKRYVVTAKLWIKVDSETEDEARATAKSIIDEALYEYVAVNKKAPGVNVGVSKAKVIWVKEEEPAL